jgi:16S rRNA U516 pseudouridylate synthase RsuA-like enzyme
VEKIRIQKMIADCGVCSRRKAEELITKGRVKLNGHPVKLGDKCGFRISSPLTVSVSICLARGASFTL